MANQIGNILEIITTHPKEITKAAPFGQPCISHYEDGFLVFQFVTRKAAPIKAVQSLSETFREDDFRLLWPMKIVSMSEKSISSMAVKRIGITQMEKKQKRCITSSGIV